MCIDCAALQERMASLSTEPSVAATEAMPPRTSDDTSKSGASARTSVDVGAAAPCSPFEQHVIARLPPAGVGPRRPSSLRTFLGPLPLHACVHACICESACVPGIVQGWGHLLRAAGPSTQRLEEATLAQHAEHPSEPALQQQHAATGGSSAQSSSRPGSQGTASVLTSKNCSLRSQDPIVETMLIMARAPCSSYLTLLFLPHL
jgi:hypothetical protein